MYSLESLSPSRAGLYSYTHLYTLIWKYPADVSVIKKKQKNNISVTPGRKIQITLVFMIS